MQLARGSCRLAVVALGIGFAVGLAPVVAAQSVKLHQTVLGAVAGGQGGLSVGRAGDFDNDGHDDVIIGNPSDDTNGTDCGSFTVFSGLTGAVLLQHTALGVGQQYGWFVGPAGDLNNNGYDDVLVGAPESTSSGGVVLMMDGLLGFVGSIVSPVPTFGSRFGWSISRNGDVDGDGFIDMLISEPGTDIAGTDAGSCWIYSGLTGSTIWAHGGSAGWELGQCVDLSSDFNGDGRADAVLTSQFAGGTGAVLVIDKDDVTLLSLFGEAQSDLFGTSLAVADLTGDGLPDLLAGAPQASPSVFGYVRGFDGQTGAILFTVGGAPGTKIGKSVAAVGDVDGDGRADFVIGVASVPGYAEVRSGVDGGLIEDVPQPDTFNSGSNFGASVAWLGDVDGDNSGFDFVVGAPQAPTATVGAKGGAGVYSLIPVPTPAFPTPVNALDGRPGRPTLLKLPPGSTLAADGAPRGAADSPGDDIIYEPVVVVPVTSGSKVVSELALAEGAEAVTVSGLGEFPTGDSPQQATSADFDGDEKTDVLTINKADNTLSLLKGLGNGTFAAPTTFPLTGNSDPVALLISDANGDGFPDALVAGASGVTTLLGNGAGSFTSTGTTAVTLLTSLAGGDLNSDGSLDLLTISGALATGPGVENGFATVLLGDGVGGFTANPAFASGKALASVLLGDFDHDSNLDALIVAHGFGQVPPGAPPQATITLYPGTGAGTFGAGTGVGTFPDELGQHPAQGALEDIDNDTFLDVVYTSSDNISYPASAFADVQPPVTLTVLLNDGAGGFLAPVSIPTAYVGKGVEPILEDVAPDPFDGNTDVILVWYVDPFAVSGEGPPGSAYDTYVAVLIGDGEGGFTDPAPNQFGVGDSPGDGAVADLNPLAPPAVTAPKLDLVFPNAVSNSLSILIGDGAGGVQQTLTVSNVDDLVRTSLPPGNWSGGPRDARTGDLNNDSKPDIVVYNLWLDSVFSDVRASLSLYIGDGLGGFTRTQYLALPKAGEFALGEFNEDNKLDVAVLQRYGPTGASRLRLLAGDGAGHVATSGGDANQPVGQTFTGGLAVLDVDADGDNDVVTTTVTNSTGLGNVVVYRNPASTALNFSTVTSGMNQPWTTVTSMVGGLIDGDGARDIVLGTSSGGLVVGAGATGATFTPLATSDAAAEQGGGALAVGDFNGDLKVDLVSASDAATGQAGVNQLLGDGTGQFTVVPLAGYSAASAAGTLRPLLADLNGDEATDLVIVHGQSSVASILVNELNGFTTYGAGKHGSNGITPLLLGKGYSTPNGHIRFAISQGLGGAPALMQIGLGKNLTNFLAVQVPLVQLLLTLGGSPGVPGAGAFSLPATLPDNIALIGVEITFDVLLKDLGSGGPGPVKFSATNGLAMLVK